MLVVFANNQTMAAIHGTPMTIFTDPVPLGNNDRASAACTVHSMFAQASASTSLVYTAQLSLDGGNTWFDSAAVTDTFTAAGSDLVVGAVNGVLLRFKYVFTVTGSANNMGSCCFDLHVNLDHA